MRPDEHKKKKNTAYKKKHGIANKSSADDGGDKKSKYKQKEDKNKTNVKTSDATSQRVSGGASNSIVDESSSSSSDTEVGETRKSYRRREVVSNWRKYELGPELDDGGPVVSRGEDFNKLLNMAGETMSHFRFKDELEWEGVKSGEIDSAEHESGTSSYLSLDLADISSSMSCIPIHQLLAIDQSLFPEDQLEAHTKLVNEKRSIYLNSVSDRLPRSTTRTKEQTQTKTIERYKDVCDPSINSNSVLNKSNADIKHNIVNISKVEEVSTNKCVETVKEVDMDNKISTPKYRLDSATPCEVSNDASNQDGSLSLQDDELDQLLDMDVVHEDKNKQTQSTDNKSNHLSSFEKNPPCPKATVKDEEKEAVELEDWLDSILD